MKITGIRHLAISFDRETGEPSRITVQLIGQDADREREVSTSFVNDLDRLDLNSIIGDKARTGEATANSLAWNLGEMAKQKIARDFGLDQE